MELAPRAGVAGGPFDGRQERAKEQSQTARKALFRKILRSIQKARATVISVRSISQGINRFLHSAYQPGKRNDANERTAKTNNFLLKRPSSELPTRVCLLLRVVGRDTASLFLFLLSLSSQRCSFPKTRSLWTQSRLSLPTKVSISRLSLSLSHLSDFISQFTLRHAVGTRRLNGQPCSCRVVCRFVSCPSFLCSCALVFLVL